MHRRLRISASVMMLVLLAATAGAAERHVLRASLYYSAVEDDYPAGTETPFRDAAGVVLARGSDAFFEAAAIEGTAEFGDGTILNIHRVVAGEMRWRQVPEALGIDARGCALVPFRSAAVDPDIVPLGTSLLIAETVGMPLPDGTTHDGVWLATDTGNGIDGKRIDLFTGRGKASMRTLEQAGIDYLDPLSAKVLAHDLPCP